MFSIMRRLYDGEVERDLGSRHGIRLRFEGKVGLLGAVTDAIDQVSEEIGDLGPRMLLYRMPDIDKYEAMSTVGHNAGHQSKMRNRLAEAVGRFIDGLDYSTWPLAAEPNMADLQALADWAVWCRSPIPRDRWGQIKHVPRPEVPLRVYANLLQLLAGAFTIGLDHATAETLVRKFALDSIPAMRRRVLDGLLSAQSSSSTRTLADIIGLPTPVVGDVCEDLAALGVLISEGLGERYWSIRNEARELAHAARVVDDAGVPS
jgi:hypothetical protein